MQAVEERVEGRISAASLEWLRASFRGELIGPDDAAYEQHRQVWNGAIQRRPCLIARCTGTADVIAAVRFAQEEQLAMSVRGGGHNVAGLAVWDGALMIDLSGMTGVHVDPKDRTVRAQGGVVWGGYDRETQAFGLASPGGLQSTTGIAGFTLGGGFGWLSRRHGLACDNLIEADVVTAGSEVVRASARENADLFWGIRGGGGNFGVVTSFRYRLHPIGPRLLCGMLFFPESELVAVVGQLREFMASAPRELFAGCMLRTAPPLPALPEGVHGTRVVSVGICYAGRISDGERAIEPLRRFARPLADLIQPRPYVAWQAILDAGWGRGAQNYWKAEYLEPPTDEALSVLADHFSRITSPLSDVKLSFLGGAIGDVGTDESAYTHRHAACILNINSRWEAGPADDHVEWTRGLWSAMRPWSAGGVYVNFLGQEGAGRVREAYGEAKFERLRALKLRYDPENAFHINQNIPPAAPPF
jgi:FAD binding domain/Berberine and berberine like